MNITKYSFVKILNSILIVVIAFYLTACASVREESLEISNKAKMFLPPSEGNAGVYVYRGNSLFGSALKKDIYINGNCLGASARGSFFYKELKGDTKYSLSTESEFSPNTISVFFKSGVNYFFEQYIKLGLIFGGAGIKEVETEKAKNEILKLKMAVQGSCEESLPTE